MTLATALAAAPAASASAQIAGVLNPPRVRRPARGDSLLVSGDSATRAGRASAQLPEKERSRLDIQAWVDSAAGALARSAPPPIPPPGGAGGRPSIFATPAVPDSLRPPPAPSRTPSAGRTRRPRTRP